MRRTSFLVLFLLVSSGIFADNNSPPSDTQEPFKTIEFYPIADAPSQTDFKPAQVYFGKYGGSITFKSLPYPLIDRINIDAYWANCAQSIVGKGINGYSFGFVNRIGTAIRISRRPENLFKYAFTSFVHYEIDKTAISRLVFMPELEISSIKGVAEYPVEGMRLQLSPSITIGSGFAPTVGAEFKAGGWKTLFTKWIFSLEGTMGFPASPYQTETSTFVWRYPGVDDITCDAYGSLIGGMDIITGEIAKIAPNSAVFAGFGIYAHAGCYSATRNGFDSLPFAIEARISALNTVNGRVRERIGWLGFGYAFDRSSFSRKNITALILTGMNY